MPQIHASQAPPLIQYIVQWVSLKHHDMQNAWSQQGGWEGWMQVELAMFLIAQFRGHNVAVRREQHCYKKEILKADLTIDGWNAPGQQGPTNHLIELKCESQHQDIKPQPFGTRFFEDIQKVTKESIKSQYKGRRLWVIGVSGTAQVADSMEAKLKKEKINVGEVLVPPRPGGPGFWGQASVWFWYKDI